MFKIVEFNCNVFSNSDRSTGGAGGPGPLLFWLKKEEITSQKEEKPAGQAKQNRHPPLCSRSGSHTE